MSDNIGTVFWITGLAGAGKTTIANQLLEILQANGEGVVILDGDSLRDVLGETQDYSIGNRKKLAFIYGRMAKLIADQGLHVIVSTISMFHDCRQQNRDAIGNYFEIYIEVSEEILRQRNKKELYSKSRDKSLSDVMVPSPDLETPKSPDLVIRNYGDETPTQIAESIFHHWADRKSR